MGKNLMEEQVRITQGWKHAENNICSDDVDKILVSNTLSVDQTTNK